MRPLRRAKEHKPDLILLDVMMPGMDGFEACKKLKEDAEVSHIPVVMVTALSEKSDRLKGLEAGADDFLTKPINDMALFARVKSLVRIKMLLDEVRLRDKTSVEMGIQPAATTALSPMYPARACCWSMTITCRASRSSPSLAKPIRSNGSKTPNRRSPRPRKAISTSSLSARC